MALREGAAEKQEASVATLLTASGNAMPHFLSIAIVTRGLCAVAKTEGGVCVLGVAGY